MNDAGRIGFVIRGDYNSVDAYDFLDVVYYNGSSYVAKKNTIGNEPNRNNDFWHIFAEGADEGDYVLKSDYATTEKAGIVKPDGTTITVSEDGTITGSNQTVIDAELSKDSENPVQNKVIAGEIESILSNKQDLLSKRHANSVSTDLNLIKESGIYVIGSTREYTNLPPELSSEAYCALVVFNSGIYIVQEIFTPFDTKGNIYYRFRTEREDGWKSWKSFGEIYDGYDETRKGFAADATQLNKEVEGSYAAGVAEEISGINANLLQRINTIDMNYAESLQNIKKTGVYAVKSATDMPSGNSNAVMEVLNFSDTNGNYCIQRIVYIEAVDWIFQRRIHQENGAGAWKVFIGADTSPITLHAYNGWNLNKVMTLRNGNTVTVAGQLERSTVVTETDDDSLAFKMSVSHNFSTHIIVPAVCNTEPNVYLPCNVWVVTGGYIYIRGQDMSKVKSAYINATFPVS